MTTPQVITLGVFFLSAWVATAAESRLGDAAQKCVSPEGAETNQPRATPWVIIPPLFSSPERARQSADYSALSGLEHFLPRCPGRCLRLVYDCPFGARSLGVLTLMSQSLVKNLVHLV